VAELFPTEIRATLSAFVVSCQVAAGSIGLAVMGAVDGAIGTSLVMVVLGASLLASLLLLRGLPETRGRDLIHAARPELEAAPEPQDGSRAVQEMAVPA
jgi:hypothetical protein